MVLFVQVVGVAKRKCRVQEEDVEKSFVFKDYERPGHFLAKIVEIV